MWLPSLPAQGIHSYQPNRKNHNQRQLWKQWEPRTQHKKSRSHFPQGESPKHLACLLHLGSKCRSQFSKLELQGYDVAGRNPGSRGRSRAPERPGKGPPPPLSPSRLGLPPKNLSIFMSQGELKLQCPTSSPLCS